MEGAELYWEGELMFKELREGIGELGMRMTQELMSIPSVDSRSFKDRKKLRFPPLNSGTLKLDPLQ
jgi:hypothetical protein